MKLLFLVLLVASSAQAAMVSTLSLGHLQKNGSRFVRETHQDDWGEVHVFEYLLAAGDGSATNTMTARVARLTADLKSAEIDSILKQTNAFVLRYNTGSEFLAGLRERYKISSDLKAAVIARWILIALEAGRVTDANLRSAFGLSVAAWDNVKVKLETLRTALNQLEGAKGE